MSEVQNETTQKEEVNSQTPVSEENIGKINNFKMCISYSCIGVPASSRFLSKIYINI